MNRRPSRGRLLRAAAVVLSGALVLTGCSSEEKAPTEVTGAQLDAGSYYQASTLPLTDTAGESRALADVDEDLTLVFFGYTHCPDICGIVMSTVASAVNRLDEADRERVDMLFVTTDPARDDAQVLRKYLDMYDPSFEGLTGDLDDILEVGTSMHVAIEEGQKLPSGGYEVAHSDQVFGVNSDGEATIVWTRETSSADLAQDIELLLEG